MKLPQRSMLMDLTNDYLTMVKIMAWYHQVTSNHLNQCWTRSISLCGIARPKQVNSLRHIQTIGPSFTTSFITRIISFVNTIVQKILDFLALPEPVAPYGVTRPLWVNRHFMYWIMFLRKISHHWFKKRLDGSRQQVFRWMNVDQDF